MNDEGLPISGANIYAVRPDHSSGKIPFTDTDDRGGFLITDLISGTYSVYCAKEEDGYPITSSTFHTVGASNVPQVTVRGDQPTPEIAIQLGPKAARLIGRIVDATTNKLVENARITLRRVDNPDNFYVTNPNQLQEKGTFKVLVPSAPFTVEVSAPGYDVWRYKNSDSKEDALQLAPGATKQLIIALRPSK